ncbi:unnamed protein product [Peniophora sp. CBMAI 1063]|nr:unnamed protein product [Peniophora sp. CBMAI 1063]
MDKGPSPTPDSSRAGAHENLDRNNAQIRSEEPKGYNVEEHAAETSPTSGVLDSAVVAPGDVAQANPLDDSDTVKLASLPVDTADRQHTSGSNLGHPASGDEDFIADAAEKGIPVRSSSRATSSGGRAGSIAGPSAAGGGDGNGRVSATAGSSINLEQNDIAETGTGSGSQGEGTVPELGRRDRGKGRAFDA